MMLRKSTLEGWLWCPYSFKLEYIDCVEPVISPEMQIGTDFHTAHDRFYKSLRPTVLNELKSELEVYRYFRKLMPDSTDLLSSNFAEMEAARWMKLLQLNRTDIFMPLFTEKYICNIPKRKHGTFDRLDRTLDDQYAVGELKTGKPHWPEVKRELHFYVEALDGLNLVPKLPRYIFGIFPATKQVMFEPTSKISFTWLDKHIEKFFESLEDMNFPQKKGFWCASCMWRRHCYGEAS